MNNRKKLFYEAKALDNSLTAKKISQKLNEEGLKSSKDYTDNMVNNYLRGKTNDDNIENYLKNIIKSRKNTYANA